MLRGIVFDIDGTLLGTRTVKKGEKPPSGYDYTIATGQVINYCKIRPSAELLLILAFMRYPVVGIWTNASSEWTRLFLENIEKKIVEFFFKRGVYLKNWCIVKEFSFIFCDSRHPGDLSKPLTTVYDIFPGLLNSTNTVIVEDTPHSVIHNPNQALMVSHYISGKDDILFKLAETICRHPKMDSREFNRWWKAISRC